MKDWKQETMAKILSYIKQSADEIEELCKSGKHDEAFEASNEFFNNDDFSFAWHARELDVITQEEYEELKKL